MTSLHEEAAAPCPFAPALGQAASGWTPQERFARWLERMSVPVIPRSLNRARQYTVWLAETYGQWGGAIYPSQARAASRFGIDKDTAYRYIKAAVDQGWLHKVSEHSRRPSNPHAACYQRNHWWEPRRVPDAPLPTYSHDDPPF